MPDPPTVLERQLRARLDEIADRAALAKDDGNREVMAEALNAICSMAARSQSEDR